MDPSTSATAAISRTSSGNCGTVILNKYKLGRLLGRGSFAKVYHAECLADNSTVAVKVIDKPSAIVAAMESNIVREVSAMRRLNHHPNILKLHEVMATKSKIYLVMELAEGGELFAKLARKGKFSETVSRRYFQQLVSTLRFCHKNGVAHRDLKPQNLLLDESGNLKVSDFGLSALPEQLSNGLLHTACGTPAYTAPEVLRRKGYDGAKADAWSCGVILFVFMSGSLPFDDRNLPNMYRKIYNRDFEIPEGISKPARNLICRLLDPNPVTRMSLEDLMNNNWFKKSMKSEPELRLYDSDLLTKPETAMNAFDIISMSSGLNLSGLFDGNWKRDRRFTAAATVEVIGEKMSEIGEKLGFKVEKQKLGVLGLTKEKTVLLAKILEVTPELRWVELKLIAGGEEVDELKLGLEDIALSWHEEVTC
jgi:serine/threonine protein kinase